MDHHLESVARALESLDIEELIAHYSPGFLFEDTAAGVEITEVDDLRRYFESLFSLPGVSFRDVVVFEGLGGRGGGEWVWSGLDHTGHPFRVKGASIFVLDDAGIARETIYYRPPPAPESGS